MTNSYSHFYLFVTSFYLFLFFVSFCFFPSRWRTMILSHHALILHDSPGSLRIPGCVRLIDPTLFTIGGLLALHLFSDVRMGGSLTGKLSDYTDTKTQSVGPLGPNGHLFLGLWDVFPHDPPRLCLAIFWPGSQFLCSFLFLVLFFCFFLCYSHQKAPS